MNSTSLAQALLFSCMILSVFQCNQSNRPSAVLVCVCLLLLSVRHSHRALGTEAALVQTSGRWADS